MRLHSVTLIMLAALTGCTSFFLGEYTPVGHSRKEFEHYVEEVFKFQNQMTSEVMMLLESDESKDHEGLLQAEQHMQQVCSPLNEYVARDIDGLSAGLFLRRRVARSTLDCDHAAHEVKALLDR